MLEEPLKTLLLVLDSDPREAAIAYRDLHDRLARFFRFNQAQDPESLADEVLDRLANRLRKADEELIASPGAFALGIARHLLQEESRRKTREGEAAAQWAAIRAPHNEEHEIMLQAIDHCLSKLRQDQRALLQSYYQWEKGAKIEHHKHLARQMGLTLNALRNRLMRTRKLLDECVRRSRGDVSVISRTDVQKGGRS